MQVNDENWDYGKSKKAQHIQRKLEEVPQIEDVLREIQNIPNTYPSKPTPTQDMQTRIILHKIEIENFKSFGGIHSIGPLNKSFTAITGPNGNGKSNLIECLLFVFGKRAQKLRSKKLGELIHRSAGHQNNSFCRVSIFFTEIEEQVGSRDEEYMEVKEGRFVITRRVDKGNISKYYINEEECKFKVVEGHLLDKGFDIKKSRFIIMQGEIERIALLKPKSGADDNGGLLEYMDEIIGSNIYKEVIQRRGREVEEREYKKRELEKRVKALKEELLEVERAREYIVTYISKERGIYTLQNIHNQIMLYENKLLMKANKEKIERREEEMGEKRLKEGEWAASHSDLRDTLVAFKKHNMYIKDQHNVIEEELQAIKKEEAEIKENIKYNIELEDKVRENIGSIKDNYQKTIRENQMFEEEIPELSGELGIVSSKYTEDVMEYEGMEEKVRGKTSNLQYRLECIERECAPVIVEVEKRELDLRGKEERLRDILDILNTQREEIYRVRGEREIMRERQTQEEEELGRRGGEIEDINKEKGELEVELGKLLTDIETCKLRKSELEGDIQNMERELEEEERSRDLSKILLKAQREKKLSGVYGRLGNLGSISSQYDIAITTACGKRLDSIVSHTTQQAENIIHYLRINKLGRTSVIPLHRVDRDSNIVEGMNKHFKCPASAHRLFDLIQFKDPKFRSAFYTLLRDTLLVDNIRIASKLAYGITRYRVVTQKGELIDISGTMSGGGRPRKGGMSNKLPQVIDIQDLNNMKGELEQVQTELLALSQRKEALIQKLGEIPGHMQLLLHESNKLQLTCQQNGLLLGREEERLKELENRVEDRENKMVLETDIRALQEEIAPLGKKVEGYTNRIQATQAKIVDVGGIAYKNQRAKVDMEKGQITDLKKKISKMNYSIEGSTKKLDLLKEEKEKNEKEMEEYKNLIEEFKDMIPKIDDRAFEIFSSKKTLDREEQELITRINAKMNEFKLAEEKKKEMSLEIEKLKIKLEELKHQGICLNNENIILKNQVDENQQKYTKLIRTYDFLDEISSLEMKGKESRSRQKRNKHNLPYSDIWVEDLEAGELRMLVEKQLDEEELQSNLGKKETIEYEISMLKEQLRAMNPDMQAMQHYKQKIEQINKWENDLNNASKILEEMNIEFTLLKEERYIKFMEGFEEISRNLKNIYQMITLGGDAELELCDSLDPFSEGILFTVRPCGKSWKPMVKLSGGEKTLSSLSFILALHKYKPSPIYCLDEIDAALDYKNVEIIGNYLSKHGKNSQFLVISLRHSMIQVAGEFIGVCKIQDITTTIIINPCKVRSIMQTNITGRKEERVILSIRKPPSYLKPQSPTERDLEERKIYDEGSIVNSRADRENTISKKGIIE